MRDSVKMRDMTLTDFWYSPSNGVTVNIVLRDLDLNIQGYKFETLISVTVRASTKLRPMTFIHELEVDILRRMASLAMLFSVTLTYIFKIKGNPPDSGDLLIFCKSVHNICICINICCS